MKRLLFIYFVIVLTSCNYFEKKKVYSEDILKEELETFNWNDVDEYPTFSLCDTTSGKDNKRLCFENTLLNSVNTNLSHQNIVVTQDVNDTIILKITIDNQGHFLINEILVNDFTRSQIPKIDSLLMRSFDSLPKIYPAIKRSQQVATQFSLPVIVSIK
jgi:hypothetical protein